MINGAGAAGIACAELIKAMGMPHGNVILCDTKGVIYQGRTDGHEPMEVGPCGADRGAQPGRSHGGRRRLFGLRSRAPSRRDDDRVDGRQADHLRHGQPRPRDHAGGGARGPRGRIVATGRSDYPNQVNNVLGFPYIFRGALDVRASTSTTR